MLLLTNIFMLIAFLCIFPLMWITKLPSFLTLARESIDNENLVPNL